MRIGANTYAEVDYVLEDDSGEILDDSTAAEGQPLRYVHGYGMLVPGLEKRLDGLEQGERASIIVPPEEAYGLHDEDLVFAVERSAAPTAAEGDELVLRDKDGDETVTHVVEVKPDEIVVDGNHPLAGLTLRYQVTVREVRQATMSEIEDAASAVDEAEPSDDDPSFVPLFALRRPKDGVVN